METCLFGQGSDGEPGRFSLWPIKLEFSCEGVHSSDIKVPELVV